MVMNFPSANVLLLLLKINMFLAAGFGVRPPIVHECSMMRKVSKARFAPWRL